MIKKTLLALMISTYANSSNFDTGFTYFKNKNYDKALIYLNKSYENNNSKASFLLGNIYAIKQDYTNSVLYFKDASKYNAQASYNLGYFYTGGLGVKRNLEKSLYWYKKSATKGYVNAQLNLAFMYIAGHGTKVNYKKAAFWLQKAKQAGNKKAQLMWDEFQLNKYIGK